MSDAEAAMMFAKLYMAMVVDDDDKINEALGEMSDLGVVSSIATAATLCEIILEGQKLCGPECGTKIPMFIERSTGERKDSTQVPVYVARAGQMTAAVANGDVDNLRAIFLASLEDSQINAVFTELINSAKKVIKANP